MTTGTPPAPLTTEKYLNNEQISKNASSAISATTDPSAEYDRRVAHAETIKVLNNRYSIAITYNIQHNCTYNIQHKVNSFI